MTRSRIAETFARCRTENRAAFVGYLMASDPDHETALECVCALAESGADIIELGMPFTDPMADGPAIQKAALRALKAGGSIKNTLETVRRFRSVNHTTPVILMGYANPVHRMGYGSFAREAAAVGADGAIIVDAPPEVDTPIREALDKEDLALIRLATPTSSPARLESIAAGASGFIYYVSVAGVTGAGIGSERDITAATARARAASGLPVVVGFGVRTPDQAAGFARAADGVVVGSALVDEIQAAADEFDPQSAVKRISVVAKSLSRAIQAARA
jgi:tryptophan synthase alpha chain